MGSRCESSLHRNTKVCGCLQVWLDLSGGQEFQVRRDLYCVRATTSMQVVFPREKYGSHGEFRILETGFGITTNPPFPLLP